MTKAPDLRRCFEGFGCCDECGKGQQDAQSAVPILVFEFRHISLKLCHSCVSNLAAEFVDAYRLAKPIARISPLAPLKL